MPKAAAMKPRTHCAVFLGGTQAVATCADGAFSNSLRLRQRGSNFNAISCVSSMQHDLKFGNASRMTIAGLGGEVPGLTGLRFVAAISVALAHGAHLILKLDDDSVTYWLTTLSGLGMGLFFVLSGFVIHYNYRLAVTDGGLNGLSSFFWARFSRLYPLYFLIVTIDILLGRHFFEFMAGKPALFTDQLRALPYYLTLTQSWRYVPFSENSLIYVTGGNSALTWSISTEWFFYLSYPLVALLVIRARRPMVIINAGLAWCAIWIPFLIWLSHKAEELEPWAVTHYGPIAGMQDRFQDSFFEWLMYFSPYVRIGEFILGCIIAQLYLQLLDKVPSRREHVMGRLLLGLGIISLLILIYLEYSPNAEFVTIQDLNLNFGLAPSVALVIFCVARYDTLITRMLNHRAAIALGEASYSIYLTHFLVLMLAASFLGGELSATMPNVLFLLSKYLFLLGLMLLISLGLYTFVEVPARQWLRGLWLDREQPRKRLAAYSLLGLPAIAAVALVLLVSYTNPQIE
jgi:peptidoglycan/LPS O-acetylase OafA/YrhL